MQGDGYIGNRSPVPRRALRIGWAVLLCGIGGCGALNPGFVGVLDPTGATALTTVDNAPGHVVVLFLNNATVDERLLSFLESAEGGSLSLTEAERRSLRPRMRLRIRITFTDGTFQTIEFIDGSSTLVDPRFSAESVPDLNQNDFSIAVVRCDVASVDLEPNSPIEVFIPVPLNVYQLVQTTTPGGAVDNEFVLRNTIPPQFRVLNVDQVDEDGNVILRQNIDVRDVLSPAINPLCGSVVAIVVDGVLSVPFLDGVDDAPSFDGDDQNTVGSIGGRYEFRVLVQ
ncbi:MAG: hypothetical protein D6788_03195 [Planctomycetota bacterium]|nr:MAG: hypothetical protein D6788_03195 [Planctomycetota bacterium]